LKAWPVLPIFIVQSLLWLAYWFLYRTWIDFWFPMSPQSVMVLRIALMVLSVSFVIATLLSFQFSNWIVKLLYWVAAIWFGLSNFLVVAALLAWVVDSVLRLALPAQQVAARPYIAGAFVTAATVAAVYGMLNARNIRQSHVTVTLPNLPELWRGRKALLVSDLHLGNINGRRFARRIAGLARRLDPAVLFIAGDLFDGTMVDPDRLAAPLFELTPPLGTYFVGGNHEMFGGAEHYEEALRRAGMRVLHDERVDADGLQIVGVPYGNSTNPLQLRAFLEGLNLKEGPASILLNHVPNRLPIAEHAGVSLQLSGHTHGGQLFPFSWITRRAFGKFTYGLQRFGDMQVYTSSGAGTWGPPMRVGTHSEVVLLTFA
jgi:predicted MPP superfamily phosphohydrolase